MSFKSFVQFSREFMLKSVQGQGGLGLQNVHSLTCPSRVKFHPGPRQPGLNDWKARLRSLCSNTNDKLTILAALFAKQCNAIAAQRMRRTIQVISLYQRLGYDRHALKSVVEKFSRSFLSGNKTKPLYFLFGSVLFSWEGEHITNEEVNSITEEIVHIPKDCQSRRRQEREQEQKPQAADSWVKIVDKDYLVIWRRPVPDSHLYEYKVYGSYTDIPARAFYNVQLDLEFRKQWDKLVIKLDVMERDEESGCEVVQWRTHFPYPMYHREYVYVRKAVVLPEQSMMAIVSRSTRHPCCPLTDEFVRVDTYQSKMVIRSHSSFDENGFDYILTYYDDPKSVFPTVAYNWMASTGVPDFVDKMHLHAKELHEKKQGQGHLVAEEEDSNYGDKDAEKIPM